MRLLIVLAVWSQCSFATTFKFNTLEFLDKSFYGPQFTVGGNLEVNSDWTMTHTPDRKKTFLSKDFTGVPLVSLYLC